MAGAASMVLGGLLGHADAKRPVLAAGCFWDAERSGISVAGGSGPAVGTGLTTEQMRQKAAFEQAGWDFRSTWTVPEGDYPTLQWEMTRDGHPEANAAKGT